ncbi:hypothetical protein FRC11_004953 [Ceratobasidium sp. 423]|nr:hypothetical protein FRC11_004953 [Ceratobasidium sp. 423]
MEQKLKQASSWLGSEPDEYLDACISARHSHPLADRGDDAQTPHLPGDSELRQSMSYRKDLDKAQIAVSAIGNHPANRGVTTIKDLPPEIIIHIFHLVVAGQPCLVHHNRYSYEVEIQYPKYLDSLSHICSTWRRIAIDLPSLWSHIDIALDHSLNPGLFERAKIYAARAGLYPLSVHISNTISTREQNRKTYRDIATRGSIPVFFEDWEDLQDFRFIASPIKIGHLEVDLSLADGLRDCHFRMLEYFLARCEPGVFTRYTTRLRLISESRPERTPFIDPANASPSDEASTLDLPEPHFEAIWLGASSVRVNGLCPNWASKAYHGLVELCLGKGVPEISEAQLVNILKSSPGLRILHLITNIVHQSPHGVLINPVVLGELEELRVIDLWPDDIMNTSALNPSNLLRWVAPGKKPLKCTLFGFDYLGIPEFCARSNITQLHLELWPGNIPFDMIRQCPGLRVLVLSAFEARNPQLRTILPPVDINSNDSQPQTILLRLSNSTRFKGSQSGGLGPFTTPSKGQEKAKPFKKYKRNSLLYLALNAL